MKQPRLTGISRSAMYFNVKLTNFLYFSSPKKPMKLYKHFPIKHVILPFLAYLVSDLDAVLEGGGTIFGESEIEQMSRGIIAKLLLLLGEIGATDVANDALLLQVLEQLDHFRGGSLQMG